MSKTPTSQEIQNFRPKCLLPDGTNVAVVPIDRQHRVQPEFPWPLSITATGFVLPCCWLASVYGPHDEEDISKDEKIKPLFDKELHIDNKTIEDIVNSDTWQNFMSDLVNRPEESSPFCFKRCSSEGNIQKEW